MSNNGWGSCAACHTPLAMSDNVVWIFPAGPRTISQHTDFDQTDPTRTIMRPLLWSANRDEQEDFTNNIRAVSGGLGLIVLADGITQDTNTPELTPVANGDRNQLKVRGVGGWDAIKAFVQFGIRAPISPVSKTDPDVIAGEALFRAANCQQCHGGPQWTSARVRFTPPPDVSLIVLNGQIFGELRSVGTFDPGVRQRSAPERRATVWCRWVCAAVTAIDSCIPADLLPQRRGHSLDEVMNNVTHRSAGTAGVDILTNAADRAKLVQFLLSIDAATPPIP